MITEAKGGDWIIGLDGARYLVLEQYPDLPMSVVDVSNGRVLLYRDVFADPEVCWERLIVDYYVTYVCRKAEVRHCA